MQACEIVVALLAGSIPAARARRLRASYRALPALADTAGALVPGRPVVALDPT